VDGAGTNLVDFFRSRFVAACTKGIGWLLAEIELPATDEQRPKNLAEFETSGLGRVTIAAVDRSQVLDWGGEDPSDPDWVIVHRADRPRRSPEEERGVIVETWDIYDRSDVTTYAVSYTEKQVPKDSDEIKQVAKRPHGFSRVPLLGMGFESTRPAHVKLGTKHIALSSSEIRGLWPMARLADIQIAHFRQEAGLEWSIARTCYAMPVFTLTDDTRLPTMGAGYYIKLGMNESVNWTAPPTAHLAIAAQRVSDRRDEIYRVANQLAQGVDNNAAAIGRSGESKLADAESTEVILTIFGAFVREAIEKTFDLISEARAEADGRPANDPLKWTVSGLDKFDVTDVAALMAAATQYAVLNVPSKTATAAIKTRAAIALLPGLSEAQRKVIHEEIEAGTSAEEHINVPEAPPEKPSATSSRAAERAPTPQRPPAVAATPPARTKAPVVRKALAAKKAGASRAA
jgi:hypothetical protein